MSELTKFQAWASESAWSDEELEVQVDAYIRTYPGRVLQLTVELIEAAVIREEEEK